MGGCHNNAPVHRTHAAPPAHSHIQRLALAAHNEQPGHRRDGAVGNQRETGGAQIEVPGPREDECVVRDPVVHHANPEPTSVGFHAGVNLELKHAVSIVAIDGQAISSEIGGRRVPVPAAGDEVKKSVVVNGQLEARPPDTPALPFGSVLN